MQYTNEYYAAKTEAGRVAAHNKAEAFRRSGYKIVSQGTSKTTDQTGLITDTTNIARAITNVLQGTFTGLNKTGAAGAAGFAGNRIDKVQVVVDVAGQLKGPDPSLGKATTKVVGTLE